MAIISLTDILEFVKNYPARASQFSERQAKLAESIKDYVDTEVTAEADARAQAISEIPAPEDTPLTDAYIAGPTLTTDSVTGNVTIDGTEQLILNTDKGTLLGTPNLENAWYLTEPAAGDVVSSGSMEIEGDFFIHRPSRDSDEKYCEFYLTNADETTYADMYAFQRPTESIILMGVGANEVVGPSIYMYSGVGNSQFDISGEVITLGITDDSYIKLNSKHVTLPVGTVDPTIGVATGSLYYNSSTKKLRIYTGAGWEDIFTAA